MNLLNCLGVGTVSSTKDTNTNEIMVYLPGFFPNADGRVTTQVQEQEQVSVNASGDEVRSKTLTSNVVPAIWKNMGNNNRLTSPDVREGSQVAIYQVTGQNTYYWTLDGVNAETFRLETVVYGWSASPQLSENTPFDVNNFYTMKVSTHDGLVALRTSQANGELSAFDVQIDGMAGRMSVGASQGSMFVVDDTDQTFTYRNKPGSVVRVDKKKMSIFVPEQLNLFATEQLNIRTKELNIQAELMQVDVKLTKWLGRIEHTGDTEQHGDYTQTGDYNLTGDIDQTGDMNQTGDLTSTGTITGMTDVTTATISLNFHLTTGVRGGNDISGPPMPGG
jgi:hypothetical protein